MPITAKVTGNRTVKTEFDLMKESDDRHGTDDRCNRNMVWSHNVITDMAVGELLTRDVNDGYENRF